MHNKRRIRRELSPLAQWLMDYVQRQEITITELARRSGLSPGAIRSLTVFPDRIPTIETCLRLAEITGKSAEEILGLAGLDAPRDLDRYHPDRLELVTNYDRLSISLRRALLNVSQALLQTNDAEGDDR